VLRTVKNLQGVLKHKRKGKTTIKLTKWQKCV